MDGFEFQRLLNLFPIVRSRDFVYDDTSSSRRLTAQPSRKQLQDALSGKDKDSNNHKIDEHDAFWSKLQMAAEKKVGAAEAERFCKDFQKIYKMLVYEEMSLDVAKHILNSSNN